MTGPVRVPAWVTGRSLSAPAPLQGPAPSVRGVGGSGVLPRVEVRAVGPAEDVRALVSALSGPAAPGRVTGVDMGPETAAGAGDGNAAFTLG